MAIQINSGRVIFMENIFIFHEFLSLSLSLSLSLHIKSFTLKRHDLVQEIQIK